MRKCKKCHKKFDPKTYSKGGGVYCSRECRDQSPVRRQRRLHRIIAATEEIPAFVPDTKASRRREYNRYLNSGAWKNKRELALAVSGYSCQRCGYHSLSGLHVHHLTYARFGKEDINDLMVLCEECHRKEHGMPPVTDSKVIWRGERYAVRATKRGFSVFSLQTRKQLSCIPSKETAITFAKGADSFHP